MSTTHTFIYTHALDTATPTGLLRNELQNKQDDFMKPMVEILKFSIDVARYASSIHSKSVRFALNMFRLVTILCAYNDEGNKRVKSNIPNLKSTVQSLSSTSTLNFNNNTHTHTHT